MSSTSASPISNITVDDELQIREGKQKIQTRKKTSDGKLPNKNEEHKQKRKRLALLIVL